MAFKGTAGKSSSGASMSKYDVEVESRLQALEKQAHPVPTGATQQKVDDRLAALEKAVAEIAAKCDSRATGGGTVSATGLKEATKGLGPEAKLNAIIDALS